MESVRVRPAHHLSARSLTVFVTTLTHTAAAVAFATTPALALPPIATQNPGTSHQQADQPVGTPTQSDNLGTGQASSAGAPDLGSAPGDRPTAAEQEKADEQATEAPAQA